MELTKASNKAAKRSTKKFIPINCITNDKLFKSYAELVPYGVMIYINGTIVYANTAAVKSMSAQSFQDLNGRQIMDYIHPDYREMVACRFKSVAGIGDYAPLTEIKLIRLSGTIIYCEATVTRMPFMGQLAHLSIIHDISKRKSIEAALGRSEERYKKIVELSPDAIFVILNNRIVLANKSAANLTGVEEENDIIGKRPYDIINLHPDCKEMFLNRMNLLCQYGVTASTLEQKLIRNNGTIVDVELTATPFPYKGENAILFIIRDMTYHKKSAKEISLKARLLDAVTDSIVLHDSKGILLYVNEAACKSNGYSRDEIMQLSLSSLYTPGNAVFLESRMNEIVEKGDLIYETAHVRKDRSEFPIEVHSHTIETDDKKLILSVSRDISDRKNTEELHKNNEKNIKLLNEALQYDKLKTEFFSNISHELRTPLNVILGALQLIDMYVKSGVLECKEPNFANHIKSMKQNCYRLLRLVNNIIDITRIDSGYINLNLKECNIVSVVEDTTQSVVEYAMGNNITLIFDTNIEDRIIACDTDKIERIILNLLSNAIKFTNPGGSIVVSLQDKWDSIIISVKDTGIGIPKDKLDIVFERFRQVDTSLNRNYEGSGIGLSIVKSLAEIHKGKISMESELGKGSEFIVELPANLVPDKSSLTGNKNVDIQGSHVGKVIIELSDIYKET